MKTFAWCVVLLLIVPSFLLNPMGRDAFVGYYLGVLAMWATFAIGSPRAFRVPPSGIANSN